MRFKSSHCKVAFETIKLNVPLLVEDYLKDRWGDYMKIPPYEETLKYHHSWKWSPIESFHNFKENSEYNDERFLLS